MPAIPALKRPNRQPSRRRSAVGVSASSPSNVLAHLSLWDLHDGFAVHDDGRLVFGCWLQPPSRLLMTDAALTRAHEAHKVVMQRGLEVGETLRIHLDVFDAPPELLQGHRDLPASPYPLINELAAQRHTMQRAQLEAGAIKISQLYCTCTVRPRRPFRKGMREAELAAALRDALRRARAQRERLSQYLQGAGLHPRPMGDQDVFGVLYRALNPALASSPAPRFVPPAQRPRPSARIGGLADVLTLRRQLCRSSILNEDHARLIIGSRHVAVVNLVRPPRDTEPGMVEQLFETLTRGSFSLVLEFTHQEYTRALGRLLESAVKLEGLARGGVVNPQAASKLRRLEATIEHLDQSRDHTYRASAALVLYGRSAAELEWMQREASGALARFPGAVASDHGFQSYSQYFALLPFSNKQSFFQAELTETSGADFFPTSAPWPGFETHTLLLRTRRQTLTRFDLYAGAGAANHFMWLARTGYGKTFSVISLLSALVRAHDPYLRVFDRKRDFTRWFTATWGEASVIPYFPGSGVSLNPFDLPAGDTAPDEVKEAFLLALLGYLVQGDAPGPQAREEEALLLRLLPLVYEQARLDGRAPLLGDLRRTLEVVQMDGEGRPLPDEQRALARSLALRLARYTGQTAGGRLLDRPTNRDTGGRHLYFDLSGIAESDLDTWRIASLVVQDRIWKDTRELPVGVKKLAFRDEFAASVRTPQDAAATGTLLRMARSANLAMGFASQEAEDVQLVGGLRSAINYFFFGQLVGGADVITKTLGFPESVAQLVDTLRGTDRYREFLLAYRPTDGSVNGEVIRMEDSRLAYWLATSHEQDQPRIEAALRQHGDLHTAIHALLRAEGEAG